MSNSEIDLDLTEIHFDFFCKVGGTSQMLHALIAAQGDDVRCWSSCPSFGPFIQKLFFQPQDVSCLGLIHPTGCYELHKVRMAIRFDNKTVKYVDVQAFPSENSPKARNKDQLKKVNVVDSLYERDDVVICGRRRMELDTQTAFKEHLEVIGNRMRDNGQNIKIHVPDEVFENEVKQLKRFTRKSDDGSFDLGAYIDNVHFLPLIGGAVLGTIKNGEFAVFEPDGGTNATDQASADIIALHGLGGDWNRTWSSFGYCWLKHALVPKFPSCRILSLNYPGMLSILSAHPPDINGLVHGIIRDRRQENRSKSPIIFLGHSFGGTVLKQVYIATHPSNTDDPEYKALHSHIRGYVFFGTIHKDRDMSRAKLEVPEFWRALSRGASGTLGGHSHELEKAMYTTFRVNHAFRRLGGENLLINCFYETKGPGGLSRRVLITQEESTLVARPVPTMPLDLDHQSLVCFKSPRDENLARVLDALDSFMIRAMDVETRLHRPIAPESRGLCLLSLDGGGVKGLFSIIIDRLMQETRRLEGPGAEHKKPCDYFDLIGGTSTGDLLATMLGRLQMDTQLCIQAYKSLSKEVFSRKFKVPFLESFRKASNVALSWSWFDGDRLKEAVCRTVKENLLPSDSAMLRQSGCTVEDLTLITDMKSATYSFVCAVPKYEEKMKRIRSYEPLGQRTNAPAERFKIWEAARATSAAPMYFPHIEAGGVSYFDGGLESNNPVIEVIEEAKQEFPDDKISTVISVGTGAYQASDASAGLAGFINYMINMATSTEKHHRAVLEDPRFADIRKEGYFRLNGTLELGAIDLAAVERMDEIECLAEAYLSSNEGQQQTGICAERLVERARHH
ncbi:patatin-like phospholipase domain containing protein [Fusarium agapanthi]|uniref:Patatin-like phospholipase domain containing protein n=1 Tax=Fusarium agapanthi TaxID=1803897 RepID=A0A9P5E304_9HYPO|nr:patatin-like phospholipase domain containing protein [Fusarium agapanthi]